MILESVRYYVRCTYFGAVGVIKAVDVHIIKPYRLNRAQNMISHFGAIVNICF